MLTIELAQITVSQDKEENLTRIISIIDKSDADIIIFPEYLMGITPRGATREIVQKHAETINGKFITKITEKSGDKDQAIVFTAYLKENGKIYNAAIATENGEIKAIYKKTHLFDAFGYKGSKIFARGSKTTVTTLKGIKIGLAICFDLRFPELFRAMALKGAELFIVPAAWYRGPYKVQQWLTLTTARAHENTTYLVAVNQTGKLFTGNSLVASPLGYIQLNLGEKERTIKTTIDLDELRETREKIPVLNLLNKEIISELKNLIK